MRNIEGDTVEIGGYSQTYRRYGGSNFYSYAGDLLTVQLGEYGTAIESIEVTAHLRSRSQIAKATLEESFDRFHANLKKLPKVTFRRTLKRVEIAFLSQALVAEDEDAADGCDRQKLSVEKCNSAAIELACALPLLRKRIKPTDDFDIHRFLTDAARLLDGKFESMNQLEAIDQLARAKRRAIYAAKDPWDLLGIDWSEYHAKAREILNEPYFWQEASDLAPNGNDTGADLLGDFKRWNKLNSDKSPRDFLDRLFTGWGIEQIDWRVIDEGTVLRLRREKSTELAVCDEAAIGLAFAVIKLRAACPGEIIQLGLNALIRTEISVKHSDLRDEVKTAWGVAIEKMRSKLESLP